MEQLPKIARERLARQQAESEHPAADVLAGFIEHSLGVNERQRVLTHLSRCADCRDAVALAMPEELPAAVNMSARRRAWYEWSVFRFGGLAAALAVIVVAALLFRPHTRRAEDASAPAQAASSPSATSSPASSSMDESISKTPAQTAEMRDKKAVAPVEERAEKKYLKIAPEGLAKGTLADRMSQAATNHKQEGEVGKTSQVVKPQNEAVVIGGAAASNVAVPAPSVEKDAKRAPAAQARKDAQQLQAQQQNAYQQQANQQTQSLDQLESNSAASQQAAASAPAAPPPPKAKNEATVAAAPAVASNQARIVADNKLNSAEAETAQSRLGRGPLQSVASLFRWTISPTGTVQRSTDGAHWKEIPVAEGAKFRTLAVGDSGVWAGGSALYHSSDLGEHWEQVTVGTEDHSMEGEISRINLPSISRVEVQTSAGQKWVSNDAGHTWKLH